jgi:hypothetical protein
MKTHRMNLRNPDASLFLFDAVDNTVGELHVLIFLDGYFDNAGQQHVKIVDVLIEHKRNNKYCHDHKDCK